MSVLQLDDALSYTCLFVHNNSDSSCEMHSCNVGGVQMRKLYIMLTTIPSIFTK